MIYWVVIEIFMSLSYVAFTNLPQFFINWILTLFSLLLLSWEKVTKDGSKTDINYLSSILFTIKSILFKTSI